MPIEFHCPKCEKLVRAPDGAGGKQGKCPSCHQTVYIPMPDDQIETLDLAPIDEAAEREQQRLEEETNELRRAVMEASSLPEEPRGDAGSAAEPVLDLETLIIQYADAMSQGRLSEAEEFAALIRRSPASADAVIQRISSDEIPPAGLENVPRPVLIGFLKQLSQS